MSIGSSEPAGVLIADHAGSAIRTVVWNENVHERKHPNVAEIYPDGIHGAIAAGLTESLGDHVAVRTATMDQPQHGLADEVLADTDVLIWWGHIRQDDVSDDRVDAVVRRVHDGMGLIVLHSAMKSKVFRRLMGTSCRINWRHDDRELMWTVDPRHPIATGVPHPVAIGASEMYGGRARAAEPGQHPQRFERMTHSSEPI